MLVGVSSYSFSRAQLDIFEVIAKTKEPGFETIEFTGFSNIPEDNSVEDYARRIREKCEEVDLPISNYTIGADFINGSGGDWQAEAQRLRQEVDVARILGAPGMRHDATRGFPKDHQGGRSFDDALPLLGKGCRAVTEYAADHGIKTMVENHGFFCQDSERIEKLVSAVDHPNFGVLIDMGNFLCVDESPEQAVARLMPYAFHVHAKDFHVKSGMLPNPGQGWFASRGGNYLRGAIIGHGEVPLSQCIRIMKSHSYNGVLSIEFEGMEAPTRAIAIGVDNLRRFLA